MSSPHDAATQLEKGPEITGPLWTTSANSKETMIGSPTVEGSSKEAYTSECYPFHRVFFYIRLLPSRLANWKWSSGPKLKPQKPMGETVIRSLQNYPQGLPKVACFLDSDEAFMQYRRFGSVFSRLLLHKQDELRRLEEELLGMDRTDEAAAENGQSKYLLSCEFDEKRKRFPEVWGRSRTSLLKTMEEKALQYAELLLKSKELVAMNRPARRDYNSVKQFLENDGGQLYEAGQSFIYEKEDIITLRPGRENAWLDCTVEWILLRLKWCPIVVWIFRSKETARKTDDQDIHYYTRNRVSNCVGLIILIALTLLIIIPVWLLYTDAVEGRLIHGSVPLRVILPFTFLFAATLTMFTQAKRQEILAASAAYCAVLMVFLGNIDVHGTS